MRTLLALVIAVVGGGCADHEDAPSFADQIRAADRRMHDRFAAARQLEYAIATNDLVAARANAHTIAQLDEADLAPAWKPGVAAVRAAAHDVELAGDVITAARAAGQLGLACAHCHEATNARPVFAEQAPPEAGMKAHQWAASRMWEGLIGSAPARWRLGASALTSVPLTLVARAATPQSPDDIDDVARIRMLARHAGAQDLTIDQRGELFGVMLASCAHCHATLRDR